jgi:two-component SAPR family response regulator
LWGILTGNEVKTKVSLAHIYAVAGRREEAESIIEDVLIHHVLGENDYRGMALVFAALGDNDAAFKWLDKSFERHEPSLSSLKMDPKMDPIRDDPRFTIYIEKLGLS